MQHKYEIVIEGLPKTLNSFLGYKWAHYKYAKEIKKQIKIALLQTPKNSIPKLSAVRVRFVLGFSTRHRSDICDRNTKPHIDALVEAGIIEDDNRFIVKEVGPTTWEKSEKPFTKIIIEEIAL